MTVSLRTLDELQSVPGLAILPALSTCIDAFTAALDVAHPYLLDSPRCPASPREAAALLLRMHLDHCQELLHEYDQLTFDGTYWCCSDPEDETPHDPDEDIPF